MLISLVVTSIAIAVVIHIDGTFSFEAISAFLGCFCLIYAILNTLQIDSDRGDFSRVMLVRNALWVRASLSDFERIPLTDLIRARTVVGDGARPVRSIRLDCRVPGGSVRHVDFLPHASFRFDAHDGNSLCGELMRLGEAARAEKRALAASASESEPLLDFRSVQAPAEHLQPFSVDQASSAPESHGDCLSESEAYLSRWYPLHWLLWPLLLALFGVTIAFIKLDSGLTILGVAVVMALFQFDLFRRASVGLVGQVMLDGHELRYRRNGRPGRLPLSSVIDIRNYYTRYYLGRTPITVRFIDGDRIRIIRFIARRDRFFANPFLPCEVVRALEAAVQNAHQRRK